MEQSSVQRRLAAVMSTDMVGFSRLMEADEIDTLARLRVHRRELVDPAIAKYKGRIIKTTGDGMLIEFASVVEALECAAEIQRAMATRNADQPADRRIDFRIGVNVGDIIVEDDDIFGDGVNVAARLQALSPPGGVCVPQAVRDQVGDRLAVGFDDLGERSFKNLARPIRVFRMRLERHPSEVKQLSSAPAAAEKPSIVVLPFANMSGDKEQEFFADGLTEDILTELSRFKQLLVISRNSAFVYKGRAVKVQDVAKELGVQFVLEGSVRKAGNRVRITVQLIDAESDRHIWAERYDRELEDIFAIQDEVTRTIVGTLSSRVEAASHERARRKTPDNLVAYEYVLTGKRLHHLSTQTDNRAALELLERAIALDPRYAHARAWKACVLGQRWGYGWFEDRAALEEKIFAEIEVALALDENDSDVHRIMAAIMIVRHDFERAAFHQDRALALNPNDDLIVVQQGEYLTWIGQAEEGIDWIKKAMRLNPYHPERFWSHLGRAYFVAKRHGEALEAYRRLSKPDMAQRAFMAACCARSDDAESARLHAKAVLEADPKFTAMGFAATLHFKHETDRTHLREALILAGLPN
ncbi:MAG: adenylate/guanylate cyclase domain-containing protein [Alphaproteobacteria bacterium]|nr:adenylate/guanylate cyclase domain-containing protein [Alphaproteobacteria bacterium]